MSRTANQPIRLRKPTRAWLVPALGIAAAALVYLLDPLAMQVLRNSAFDQYQRWDARAYQDAPLRIIDIDEESLAKLGQWPWPRTRIAELINILQTAGAATISLDVLLAEPDRTSPLVMLDT